MTPKVVSFHVPTTDQFSRAVDTILPMTGRAPATPLDLESRPAAAATGMAKSRMSCRTSIVTAAGSTLGLLLCAWAVQVPRGSQLKRLVAMRRAAAPQAVSTARSAQLKQNREGQDPEHALLGTVALSDSGRTGDATAAEARIQGPPKRHKFPRFASLCGHASSPSSLNATVPPALVQGAAAPQPACPADLDPDEPHRAPMATTHPRHAPLAECAFRRHTPEVGAQCGNPACWDPCGGPSARAVPTATLVVAIRPEVQDHRGTLSPARW